jgi:hypothetical protein
LSHDSKAITLDRKQLIWEMLAPKTKDEILSIFGTGRILLGLDPQLFPPGSPLI